MKISNLTHSFTGGTPSRSKEDYFGGNISWAKSGELNAGYITTTEESLTEKGLKESSAKMVEPDTVLVALYGATAGVVGMAKIRTAINQAVLALNPRPSLNNHYLMLALRQVMPREVHVRVQGGQPNLSSGLVNGIKIPVPPLEEQKKIADILRDWDDAIEKISDLIDKAIERRDALAQKLFTGKERLPEFRDNDPWQTHTLGNFFEYYSKRNREDRDLPILSCSKIYGIVPQAERFDSRIASKDISNYKIVSRGDLVYDPMLLWDGSIEFVECVGEGVVSPAYYTFSFEGDAQDREFFRYLFQSHYLNYQYGAISQGTNARRKKAPREAFLGIEVSIPPSEERQAIGDVLSTCDHEIDLLEEERSALVEQKKGIMQKLLTGKVRV